MVGPPVSPPSGPASHPQQWDALGALSCLHCGSVHSVPPPQKALTVASVSFTRTLGSNQEATQPDLERW